MIFLCQRITKALFCLREFKKAGIRGFAADYYYDYTCMETLQGLSASELSSAAGRKWRTIYNVENTKREGLDSTVWPEAFERMERFIKDTGLSRDDLDMNYDDVIELYKNGKVAMYFGQLFRCKRYFRIRASTQHFCHFFNRTAKSG